MAASASSARASADKARGFFQQLAREGATRPVYLLMGDERYLVDEALSRLEQSVFGPARDDFNYARYTVGDDSMNAALAAAESLPMFQPRRMVVVRSLQQATAQDWPGLLRYVREPSPSTVLVLEATKLDERLGAVKELLKLPAVEVVALHPLPEEELPRWLVRRARGRGLVLGRDVPEMLVAMVGTGLATLDQALERIDLSIPAAAEGEGRPVTEAAVLEVVSDARERTVFEWAEHVTAGEVGLALASLERLLSSKHEPVALNALLTSQVRTLLRVRVAMDEGLRGQALAERTRLWRGRLEAAERVCRRYSQARLVQLLLRCVETDALLKRSRLPSALLVERLTLAACLGEAASSTSILRHY